jgi:lipopolysaccharide transport system permease protein
MNEIKNNIEALNDEEWDEIILPKRKLFDLQLKGVWKYRDLLYMQVKRDFIAVYKQTILGPLWFVIQPLLTTLAFTIIFGKFAKIGTDGIPHVLFYLGGITCWNFFSESLTGVSSVFKDNQGTFGKVYFPRLIPAFAVTISKLQKFSIQLLLFLCVYFFYLFTTQGIVQPQLHLLLLPILIFLVGLLALGFGLLITSLTTKYKDLTFLLNFGVQLFMYATPVIYPLSTLPEDKQIWLSLNPMTSFVETFKFSFLGSGTLHWGYLLYSSVFAIVAFFIGIIVYNKVERNFMDTI